MKVAVVVLALAGLCHAAPEADPQLLLASPYAALPLARSLPLAYAPAFYHSALPLAAPAPIAVAAPAPLPLAAAPVAVAPAPLPLAAAPVAVAPAPLPLAAAPVAVGPVLTSHDCVTPGGCAVATLKAHGLAKRESEPDAVFANNFFGAPAALPLAATSPFYSSFLPSAGLYSNLAYATGYPYAGLAATASVRSLPLAYAPAATGPALVTPALAAPQPLALAAAVPAVAPTPLVKTVAVRPPIVAPVVEEHSRPVTYTHLGAHPITPTTVIETDRKVVGHQFI